jgi:ribosomal protein S27E
MDQPMKSEHPQSGEQPGFKIVCGDCGSLSIKLVDPVNSSATATVQCGRCGAILMTRSRGKVRP